MANPTGDLSKLRVAVVGLGSIGNRHLTNLGTLGVARRVVVRRTTQTNPQFQPPADVTLASDATAAIHAGLDAALICTPSSLHLSAARPFVQAGLPILVEKPVETNSTAAQELVELALQQRVHASVAYCMRYHPAYRAAAEFLRRGELGEVTSAEAHFHTYLPDWHPYEDYRQSYAARSELGGGVIPTLDHEIDFLLWALGPAVVEQAELEDGRDSLQIDVPVAARMQLHHSAGMKSKLSLSLASREFSRGFVVRGERGELRFDFQQGELLHAGSSSHGSAEPVVLARSSSADTAEMYLQLLHKTLTEIVRGLPPSVPLSAGVAALEICEQAKQLAG